MFIVPFVAASSAMQAANTANMAAANAARMAAQNGAAHASAPMPYWVAVACLTLFGAAAVILIGLIAALVRDFIREGF
jgi:hypothetical protein